MSLEGPSKVDPEEDTVFVAEDEAGTGKAEVVMDSASLELLRGSTIDFQVSNCAYPSAYSGRIMIRL
jgi:Fe-S cluster assembly iron-binding protein IscA